MRCNPVEFHYQLVIGRSNEKNQFPARIKTLRRLREETGFDIMTYDTLLNYYRNGQRYKKDILSLSKDRLKFKYIHAESTMLFSYVGSDAFILTSDQKENFKSQGYEIDEWENGKALAVNGKISMETANKSREKGGLKGVLRL